MSGYDCKFVHPLLKRHECPLCHLAMRNPMQTECGHLFCKECLEPVISHRNPLCPLDKEPVSREGVFPDNACRREILNLDVQCGFPGCQWTGKLGDFEEHVAECEFGEVQCKMCGGHVQRRSLSTSIERMRVTQQNQSERIHSLEQLASGTERRLTGLESRIKTLGDRSEGARYSGSTLAAATGTSSPIPGAQSHPTIQQFEALGSKPDIIAAQTNEVFVVGY